MTGYKAACHWDGVTNLQKPSQPDSLSNGQTHGSVANMTYQCTNYEKIFTGPLDCNGSCSVTYIVCLFVLQNNLYNLHSSRLVCSCICERCTDDKIVKTAFSAVELLLTRVEKGLNLSEEMLMMISSLAYSAGILCDNCEKQLADKFAINDDV